MIYNILFQFYRVSKGTFIKIVVFFLGVFACSSMFASYDSRVAEIDQLFKNKSNSVKSYVKITIPKYKGDMITFKRLSNLKDIFDLDHNLPFESEDQKGNPIKTPDKLQDLMKIKKTELQNYPITAYNLNGVINQNDNTWAIVTNLDVGKKYYIKVGDLIGLNYGVVKLIDKKAVLINEWKKDLEAREWKKQEYLLR